jgi:outer membrane protein OmpA-like peptidoglycan-associated protein
MRKKYFLIIFLFSFLSPCFSQSSDPLHHYTDSEVTKLTNYISDLEKKVASTSSSESNPEEKKLIAGLLKDPSHAYSDDDIIKISKYIKALGKRDSINQSVIAATAKRINDSITLFKSTNTIAATKPLVAYPLTEQKEIDNYEKVIFFNRRTDTLKVESYKPLDEVVTIIKKYPDLHFEIEGHTDSVGSFEYNMDLSQKRAKTVMNYFISKGVVVSQLSSIGYGETQPIDTNETPEGKARNRRVEIRAKK